MGTTQTFKRILLPLDGSELSEQAIEQAILQAQAVDAQVHLLRVVRPVSMSQKGGMASISVIESAETDLQRLAEEYLTSLADQIREQGLSVNTAIRIGIPYIEILEYAGLNEIDLIVMATRGESGITRWLLGTVTDHVVRGSQVPVMVVPVDTG